MPCAALPARSSMGTFGPVVSRVSGLAEPTVAFRDIQRILNKEEHSCFGSLLG